MDQKKRMIIDDKEKRIANEGNSEGSTLENFKGD